MLMKFAVINHGLVIMLKSEMASWFIQGDKSTSPWSVRKVTHQRDLTERDRHLKTDRHLHRTNIVYFHMHIIIIMQSIHKEIPFIPLCSLTVDNYPHHQSRKSHGNSQHYPEYGNSCRSHWGIQTIVNVKSCWYINVVGISFLINL